jgi:hypothetical protein
MFNFENFPGYDIYETIDYPDWCVPYTREFSIEGTTIVYNGVPAIQYNAPLIEAYTQALDEVLSQGGDYNYVQSGDTQKAIIAAVAGRPVATDLSNCSNQIARLAD